MVKVHDRCYCNMSVHKGENISTDGILKPYILKVPRGKEDSLWQTHVVMSDLPRNQLPTNLSQDGAKRLCDVESVLKDRGVEMKMKNRHWYNRGEKYVRARFDIKVILGSADLKFQLQTKDMTVLSRDHDAIQVKWEVPKQSSTNNVVRTSAMYREH